MSLESVETAGTTFHNVIWPIFVRSDNAWFVAIISNQVDMKSEKVIKAYELVLLACTGHM